MLKFLRVPRRYPLQLPSALTPSHLENGPVEMTRSVDAETTKAASDLHVANAEVVVSGALRENIDQKSLVNTEIVSLVLWGLVTEEKVRKTPHGGPGENRMRVASLCHLEVMSWATAAKDLASYVTGETGAMVDMKKPGVVAADGVVENEGRLEAAVKTTAAGNGEAKNLGGLSGQVKSGRDARDERLRND